MQKFTHIEAFHTVVKTANRLNGMVEVPDARAARQPVTFRGTVKLHGTNAGVRCTADALVPQSRNQALVDGNGHMGFAQQVARPEVAAAIRAVEAEIRTREGIPPDKPLTLFGEWCGPGVQGKVAVSALDAKQWVLFAVVVGDDDDARYLDAVPTLGDRFAAQGIYSVLDGPTYEMTVDFLDPAALTVIVERAVELTLAVEERCPWAARFGVEGVGEGIVWTPVGPYFGRTELFFKTKGAKHRKTKGARPNVQVAPEVLTAIGEFVEYALTEGRLEQGIEALREEGKPIEMRSMGDFLRWIGRDVHRECADELEASGMAWKSVQKAITEKARGWFIRHLR